MKVLITGANGFVGRTLVRHMKLSGHFVRAAVRDDSRRVTCTDDYAAIGAIDRGTDWTGALKEVECIIHTAARVHEINDLGVPLAAYREVNVLGTQRLAEQAAATGARRLVFLSSIKVNGESTTTGSTFTAHDRPAPIDPYGISKWEAEQVLTEVSARTGLEVVIVRLPLVYGPGVKGNFARLVRWVHAGIPLPFGAVRNRRSLVSLDNLVDLLACCAMHSRATGQVFLASDGDDISTPELIHRIARALKRPARLFPIPPRYLTAAAKLLGRSAEVDRLIGSLQMDIGHTCATLGWRPPGRMDECLDKTVSHTSSTGPNSALSHSV